MRWGRRPPPPTSFKDMRTLKAMFALTLVAGAVGCSSPEQTTDAEAKKAATEGQKPDPEAAKIDSPMGEKGGG